LRWWIYSEAVWIEGLLASEGKEAVPWAGQQKVEMARLVRGLRNMGHD
jgi:hypothetical protein